MFFQIGDFSLANGGSCMKFIPLSSSDAGIMNTKGVLPVSISRVKVEAVILSFHKLDARENEFFCV